MGRFRAGGFLLCHFAVHFSARVEPETCESGAHGKVILCSSAWAGSQPPARGKWEREMRTASFE